MPFVEEQKNCGQCGEPFRKRYGDSADQWAAKKYCSTKCSNKAWSEQSAIPLEEKWQTSFLKGGPDECWIWTGSRDDKGYGMFRDSGRKGKVWKAHRISYEKYKGTIPKGMVVCHSCDNPSCINPSHLWVGTMKDNMADCSAKKRTGPRPLKGEMVGTAKLDWRHVQLIRLAASKGATFADIGKAGETHPTNVALIVYEKRWKEVTE